MPTDKSYTRYVDKCRRQREKIRILLKTIEIDPEIVIELKPANELK